MGIGIVSRSCGAAVFAFALNAAAGAATFVFDFILQGSQEVPPNASPGTGSGTVTFNDVTGAVSLTGSFSGLLANSTVSHIHQAAVGVNGGIILGLTGTGLTSGMLTGSGTFTSSQISAMLAGNTYVNVHSQSFLGGELRGQIERPADFRTLECDLAGSNEVPPNASPGSGSCTVNLQATTGQLSVTGTYSGMIVNSTASHIHQAAAGANGPIIVGLTHSAATGGTLSGSAVLTGPQVTAVLAGNTYINVHSSAFPGGELRGQLMEVKPCSADIDASGSVNVSDLLSVIANWGAAGGPADIAPPGGDRAVNVSDLLTIISAWGDCP